MSDLQQRINALSPAKQALLKQRLQAAQGAGDRIPRRDAAQPAPLSFAQEGLCFLDRLDPNSCAYTVPQAFWLRGILNTAALQESLRRIMERHEALRARITWRDGLPVQEITTHAVFDLPVVALKGSCEADRDMELQRLAEDWVAQPFDLAVGPLIRAQLVQVNAEVHLLLLNTHHIVFDGWSQTVLAEELSTFYSSIVHSGHPPPPALPIQYADFAAWQRGRLSGAGLERQLTYWQNQLADAAPLVLPMDQARPARQTYRGARFDFKLSPEIAAELQRFNQREGVTSFTSLLAAFQALLMRYCGQHDVVVGVPTANRQQVELEGLIGFFVNMLALRVDLAGNLSFRDAVKQLHVTEMEAFQHQDLPFEKLVEALRIARDPGCHPVFQVVFAFQNTPEQVLELAGLTVKRHPLPSRSTRFDLELHLQPEAEGLAGAFYFNTDLFNRDTIERLANCFQVLLTGAMAEPERPVAELPLLTATERQRLLFDWNATAAEYPRDKCIHQLFEDQVERTPDAVAVVFENQRLTYRELNANANRVAHALCRQGVGHAQCVGLLLGRSVEFVITVLGILKAGAAYLPLDPEQPAARLQVILRTAAARLVIGRDALPAVALAGAGIPFVDWETLHQNSLSGAADSLPARNAATDLAYVMFTSGSTGEPKGVMVPHRAVVRLVRGQSYLPFHERLTFLMLSPTAFDASTLELWAPLLDGGKLALYPEGALDLTQLGKVIATHRVTCLWLTSALFNVVLDQQPETLSSLRYLLSGGEALSVAHIRRALARLPQTCIINGYGPTEGTTFTTTHQVNTGLTETMNSVPIGRPLANTQVYILDQRRQPVPIGFAGELYIGGDGLALGYLHQPALTAERFVPDPFSSTPDARLYRTGDRCRYLPDGSIDFLGRLDHQVKIRGFRIELGEIEGVLGTHPGIQGAVVVAKESGGGDKKLVAYVVVRDQPGPGVAELREFLKEKLPDYMIPAAMVNLANFPLNANGKIDRQALPEPQENAKVCAAEVVAPRTTTETKLAAIWSELLGVAKISVHDNFFDLGGHSLLAVRLQARVEKELGVKLSLVTIFQHPILEALATAIQLPTDANSRRGIFPLTTGNATPELYFIINETSLGLLQLARLLENRLSLFASTEPLPHAAVEASSKGEPCPLPAMESLAALHVEQIHQRQGTRPCLLAGHCFSGILAFEIAHQLQRAGTPVEGVVMLDSWMKSPGKLWWQRAWLRTHLQRTLLRGPGYLLAKLRTRRAITDLRKASSSGNGEFDILPGGILPAALEKFCQQVLRTYRPRPLASRGIVLISKDDWASHAYRKIHPALGAESYFVNGLKTVDVPGDHVTMLKETNLHTVAAVFQDCVKEFRERRE